MSDSALGNRDRRGDWRPPYLVEPPAPIVWPPRAMPILKWFFAFPGFLWPWNSLYLGVALLTWFFLTPDLASMQRFAPGWIAFILGRNVALTLLIYGAWHLHFYVIKGQGSDFKYTNRPLAKSSKTFTFGDQVRDNMFWTLVSGVSVWTAYEVVTLWAYANDLLPFINWETNPIWFVVLLILVPILRELHFYWVHRLIHWPPLYRTVHALHHRNVNIGPWSGLSMHPVEHVLYFSGVLIHWVVASHPIHALFHMQHAALSPAQGHCGFDRIVVGGGKAVMVGNYFHYLHHKHFECNYSGDGLPLFDKLFGTYHDGSDAAEDAMNKRFLAQHGAPAQGA